MQKHELQALFKNYQNDEDLHTQSIWKVLIYDTYSQNILSTLLKVGNLRDLNITLHNSILTKREKLHGMNAYYLIQPTQDNINLITEDFQKDIYDKVHIHFTSQIQDQLLEKLALNISKMQQPILLLLPRNIDFSSQLMHGWHYGSLVDDILSISSNKVKVEGKIYDLDCINDQYWNENINQPLPNVAEDIDKQMQEWQQGYDKMMQDKNISNALDNVQNMKDKKRLIETHMTIAAYILSELKKRQLDKYFELAQAMVQNKGLNREEKNEFMEILQQQQNQENQIDNVRILIIWAINIGTSLEEYEKYINMANIQNEKYIKILNIFKPKKNENNEDYYNKGSIFGKITSKVKLFLPGAQNENPTAQLVNQIIESKGSCWDKCGLKQFELQTELRNVQTNADIVVVFMIDGANYNEYQSLCELMKKYNSNGTTKYVLYGGSQVLNAKNLLEQL
ncbi:sec1 family protein, putative [Ichthyophthirius multifiliis]|uniref:Sec1 family protein, putative n=1 Tax=Ichthyophthirius multifiliis TaxID=5932 RepID=G0QQR1_ICHMU|nr:sec1 family protein, putative [Ichthyophthirius multifiliis]EGR32432.1 sec1 family protein, putative [Ichthyophthirius multifiliis]|eukprot:XP_004036418.1 sec1 family protein, putative [Ichthyophthirius multifiliis]